MVYRLERTVVFVGMMGAGKTAVGTAVARIIGVPFIDSDDAITEAANMTISEIFEEYGEPFFREKEGQVLARLLAGPPCILSTGGGAFMSSENRDRIAAEGTSLWLRATLDLLWSRVRHKTTRPLLQTPDPYGTLKAMLEERAPIYGKADIVVDSRADYTVGDMAEHVVRVLLDRPDILTKEAA